MERGKQAGGEARCCLYRASPPASGYAEVVDTAGGCVGAWWYFCGGLFAAQELQHRTKCALVCTQVCVVTFTRGAAKWLVSTLFLILLSFVSSWNSSDVSLCILETALK